MNFELHLGDCIEGMRKLPDNHVDAIVTDPPYELGFMGKAWDASGIANNVEMWAEALRVLKPGGHLLAFSGSRTYHRMVCAIEDAGFEIRDQIMWVYGSGFPKSLDVSKAIDKAEGAERQVVGVAGKSGSKRNSMAGDSAGGEYMETAPATDAARQWQGWGTALKPAHEPIVVARKPLVGTVAANVLQFGTGALNIDGCRVGDDPGRWPANLIHDGSDEVLAAFPQAPGQLAKASTADTARNGQHIYGDLARGSEPFEPRADAGSAARFFKETKWDDSTNAGTAASTLCLQKSLVAIVQNAAATWPSLAGVLHVENSTELFTNVTASEFASLRDCFIGAMQPIESECLPESLHEKHSPCRSLARVAVSRDRTTGITTITTSLSKSGGSVEAVTFSITPTSLDRGVLDCGQLPARLTYCPKASRKDRNEGCEALPKRVVSTWGGDEDDLSEGKKSTVPKGNHHPTVKPTELMRYLCRLVTPPGGTVLDPFAGSGSTGKACALEGFGFLGFELSPEYVAIAHARIMDAAAGGFA